MLIMTRTLIRLFVVSAALVPLGVGCGSGGDDVQVKKVEPIQPPPVAANPEIPKGKRGQQKGPKWTSAGIEQMMPPDAIR
jgi:hypothetical protein